MEIYKLPPYQLIFLMMIVMHVSLGGQSLANLCLRGYDKIHIPEFPKGDRGKGAETLAKDLL
jgi:hypothetical protein